MKIEQVNFHYLALDEIRNIGDGSQDALLVEVVMDNGARGWGECEAAPLVSIAAWCCPMSHLACKPLRETVIGFEINKPEDIFALTEQVRRNSFDLLQADHTLSGIDIALWDMLGKVRGEPVWKMLGYDTAYKKIPYASQLFGDTPQETYEKAVKSGKSGFRAAKFGWGPFGLGSVEQDFEHVRAAREGLGKDVALMVDAGTAWNEDIARAKAVLPVLEECRAVWLEEPFAAGALKAYGELSKCCPECTKLAAGEGAHNPAMAENTVTFGGVGYLQIDTGRIGGFSSAFEAAKKIWNTPVRYVNHTFTTMLALSSSLQPFAGMKDSVWCEYPVESSELAQMLTKNKILPDADGELTISEAPGLGMEINTGAIARYGRNVEISYEDKIIWSSK